MKKPRPISLRVSNRDQLEAEQLRLTKLWCEQLSRLASCRNYLARLRDAPISEWRSEECAETLARLRHHESTAASYNILLQGVERDIALIDAHQETMATARQHLARRRQ
jgi:hypothetical protein